VVASVEQVLGFVATLRLRFSLRGLGSRRDIPRRILVPGDLVVLLGGGVGSGPPLVLAAVMVVVALGVIAGTTLSFWIGKQGGVALIERWGARVHIDPKRIQMAEDYFRSHGAKTVFLGELRRGSEKPGACPGRGIEDELFALHALQRDGSSLRSIGLVAIGYAFGANLPNAIAVAAR